MLFHKIIEHKSIKRIHPCPMQYQYINKYVSPMGYYNTTSYLKLRHIDWDQRFPQNIYNVYFPFEHFVDFPRYLKWQCNCITTTRIPYGLPYKYIEKDKHMYVAQHPSTKNICI